MKIYEFINSRDIREHWNNIGFKPNALESAWLVWQSKNHTIKEKHNAWNFIIQNTVDCAIPEKIYPSQHSLHKFLARHMEAEDYLIHSFYKSEENAVYSYRMYFDEWYNETILFRSFKKACDHAYDNGEPPQPLFIEFTKTYIDEDKRIFIRFNPEREIVYVAESHYLPYEPEHEIFQDVFFNMRFSFPLPFKKGDIVEEVFERCTPKDAFVLTSICDGKEDGAVSLNKNECVSDMSAYGYFIDCDGVVWHEHIFPYMDLEHVRHELVDEDKILLPISKYLKGEIDLGLLLGAFRNIFCHNEANNVYLSLNYTKKEKELAGMEK